MERKYVKENQEKKDRPFIFTYRSEFEQFLNKLSPIPYKYKGTIMDSPISDYAKDLYTSHGYVYIIII